jgi:hypothetical protein
METGYEYGEEGPKPTVSHARREVTTEAFAAAIPYIMLRNMGNPSAEPAAASVAQKTHQLEQQHIKTRMLLQQHEQGILDEAYRVLANSSSFGSMLEGSSSRLAGARPGLDPRIQAHLQQRPQMDNGVLPTHHVGLASSPQSLNADLKRPKLHELARLGGALKKLSTDQAPYVQASQVPDPPVYPPSDPEDEYCVVEEGDDEVKEDEKPQYIKKSKGKSFPHKLYLMLEEAEKNDQADIVSFSPDGRAIVIHQESKFMQVIMPRYFKTTRMLSFKRQLQIYGFRRVANDCDKGGYYHKYFLKGQKELLEKIPRKVSTTRPKPTYFTENLEETVRAYQRAKSSASPGIRGSAPPFILPNSPRQQDLISQSLSMNIGGQRYGFRNGLLGFPETSAMDLSSDPTMLLGSLVEGGNSSLRSHVAAAGIGTSGLSGDPIYAFLLRKQQLSDLLIERQRQSQAISDVLHLLS